MNTAFSPRRFPAKPAYLLGLLGWLAASASVQADSQITISRVHRYTLTPSTVLMLDGRPISSAQLQQLGAGFNTHVVVSGSGGGLAGGEALAVELRTLLKGPVTATNPLRVLNQPIGVNGDTVLVGLPAGGLDAVAPGDLLQVSGYVDSNGSIVASRLDAGLNPATDWKLSGFVSNLGSATFTIGSQLVDFGTVIAVGCEPVLGNGQFVEVESVRNANYTGSAVLGGVRSVTCEDLGVDGPPGAGQVSLEGIVSLVPDPPTSPLSFQMAGITVLTTAQTEFRGGTADDVDEGVRLEAEGTLDAAQSTLLAREVRFTQAQVRMRAPLAPTDVIPGESLVMFGSTVRFAPQTRDDDGIVAHGLSQPREVEVVGFVDGTGSLFASRVRDRGNAGGARLVFGGPVTRVEAPTLNVLGQTIDTGGAQFRDEADQVITAEQFFAQVRTGSIIKATDCTYDAVTQRITAQEIELDDDAGLGAVSEGWHAAADGVSRGTLSALDADTIFASGFQ